MRSVNIQEAKTHLSRLVEEAARGEEIVIAKAGKPYVRLVPYVVEDTPRELGAWKGRVDFAEDFDRTPDEIVDLFESEVSTGARTPKKKAAPRRRRR